MINRSTTAQLQGDWTIAGVVRQITPLTELSGKLDLRTPRVDIDCSGIEVIDACGFQLLYTWLHCLQMRGFQPTLVEVPDVVQRSQRLLGLANVEIFGTDSLCS